jgi:hypothetical protein
LARSDGPRIAGTADSRPTPTATGPAAPHRGRAPGTPGAAGLHLANLGRVQHQAGDPAQADTLRRAVEAAVRAGGLRLLAGALVALAQVLLATGDRPAARELLEAADRWYAASGAGDEARLAAELLATAESGTAPPFRTT